MQSPDEIGRKIVSEALLRHGVKVSLNDPFLIFSTVVELTLVHMAGVLYGHVDESVAAIGAATEKSLAAQSSLAAERVQLRKQVSEDLATVTKQFLCDLRASLSRIRQEDENAASYRIDEASRRALAVGGDPRWKHWLQGAIAGWSAAVVVYIVLNVAGKRW